MNSPKKSLHMCPSSFCTMGGLVLGYIQDKDRVNYFREPVFVTQDFLDAAAKQPERKFRFAGICAEDACANWTGLECDVPRQLMLLRHDQNDLALETQNTCFLYTSCRWRAQVGEYACTLCPMVITDSHANVQTSAGVWILAPPLRSKDARKSE